MQSYWFNHGHNYDYVYLLNLVRHAEIQRRVLLEPEDETTESDQEHASLYVAPALEYFESFADVADDLWKMISSPFVQDSGDMDEFIRSDDSEEDDVDEHIVAAGRERATAMLESMAEDQRLVEYYKQRAREEMESNEESNMEEQGVDGQEGADDAEDIQMGGGWDEPSGSEEEEEDEWDKMQKKRRGAIGRRKSETPRRRKRRQELTESEKKRRVIRDSDDEDE